MRCYWTICEGAWWQGVTLGGCIVVKSGEVVCESSGWSLSRSFHCVGNGGRGAKCE